MDCKTKLILWRSGFKLYTMYNLFILIDHMLRPNQLFVVDVIYYFRRYEQIHNAFVFRHERIVTWNQLKTYKWTKDNMEQIIKCFSCLILLTILFSMECLIFYLSSNFKTTNITFGCTSVKQILSGLALLYYIFIILLYFKMTENLFVPSILAVLRIVTSILAVLRLKTIIQQIYCFTQKIYLLHFWSFP